MRFPNGQWLVASDEFAASVAVALGEVRPQMFHVVAELSHRADSRARGTDGIALAQRDSRWDAVDAINLRLVHPVKKLSNVRGEGLNVAALAFGKERVERERAFARAAQTGEHDEIALGQIEVEVFEVIVADATKPDGSVGAVAMQWLLGTSQSLAEQSLT